MRVKRAEEEGCRTGIRLGYAWSELVRTRCLRPRLKARLLSELKKGGIKIWDKCDESNGDNIIPLDILSSIVFMLLLLVVHRRIMEVVAWQQERALAYFLTLENTGSRCITLPRSLVVQTNSKLIFPGLSLCCESSISLVGTKIACIDTGGNREPVCSKVSDLTYSMPPSLLIPFIHVFLTVGHCKTMTSNWWVYVAWNLKQVLSCGE